MTRDDILLEMYNIIGEITTLNLNTFEAYKVTMQSIPDDRLQRMLAELRKVIKQKY